MATTLLTVIILAMSQIIRSQNNECSFSQYVVPGKHYRINNPGFPEYYPRGSSCSWLMSTKTGYQVVINCGTVDMPIAGWRCLDYLAASTTGDLRDAEIFCKPFTISGNTVRVQMVSSMWLWGGLFTCDITSEPQENWSNVTKNCPCGWSFSSRIVGGKETGINEFPSMALLVNVNLRAQWCGATLIAPRVSLTAGHCFTSDQNPNHYGLLVGEHDISKRNESNATVLLKISRIIVHELSLPAQGGNDIALVITTQNIVYTARVGPACLPFNLDKNDLIRKYVVITGWGSTEYGGPTSNVLRKINVQVIPDAECINAYKNKYKPVQHLCSYMAGKDACQFDSGGPLYYFNNLNNRYTLVGIVSYGNGCAMHEPSLNVNVKHYLRWILENLPGIEICN